MGTLVPANGPHQHQDGSEEALLQGLVLLGARPRTRGRVRKRAQSVWEPASGEADVLGAVRSLLEAGSRGYQLEPRRDVSRRGPWSCLKKWRGDDI